MNYLIKINIGVILVVFGIMVSACEEVSTSSQVHSKLEPCEEEKTDHNVYKMKSTQEPSGSIFIRAFMSDILSTDVITRREALGVLKDELKRWSDHKDILVTDNHRVRITLTYISPDLVEIIFLNQKLSQLLPVARAQFINELRSHFEYLAKRDELIFLVTVTDSHYTPQISETDKIILNIPIENMMLLNSGNHYATYKHFDPPLGQDIHISHQHLSGYLTFPMSVQKNGTCVPMIDSEDTMISIKATGIKLSTNSENTGIHESTWSFKYQTLMDLKITPTTANFNHNVTPECIPVPPTPNSNLTMVDLPDVYWEEMARYVWGYLVNP